METFKEFLETSTIHGLYHISAAKAKLLRLFWIFTVFAGFIVSSIMIMNSFQSWKESPILSSTQTRPISEAQFPKVTVCPPEWTNTLLNYDIAKTTNETLDIELEDDLVKSIGPFEVVYGI